MIIIPKTAEGLPIIIEEKVLREKHDNNSLKQKIANYVISLLREVQYGVNHIYRCFKSSENHHTPDQKMNWNPKSEGLYVLVHGLSGHPSIWDPQIAEIKKNENLDIFAPFVPQAGRCTLEEAAEPLLANILDYALTYPDRPISLLGVSNGCRIILWLENQLREKAQGTAVKISAVAGVNFGTTQVNLAENYGIGKYFLHTATRQELQFGSEKAQELLKNVVKECPQGTERSYDFFATTVDLLVPCLNSSLPQLGLGEQHHVVHDYGHNSIVRGVCNQQMQICEEWRKTQLDKMLAA